MNKKELKKCGIKLENLRDDKFYEANIIVQKQEVYEHERCDGDSENYFE